MFNDMDFLSQVTPLVDALGVNPSTMRRNPFALPHNLDQSTPPPNGEAKRSQRNRVESEASDKGTVGEGRKESENNDNEDEEEDKDDDAKRFREAEWTLVQEKKRVLKKGSGARTTQQTGITDVEPWHMSSDMMMTTNVGGGRAHTLEPLPYASTPDLYNRALSRSGLRHIRGSVGRGWLRAAKQQMEMLSKDLDKSAWPYNSGTGRGKAKKGERRTSHEMR